MVAVDKEHPEIFEMFTVSLYSILTSEYLMEL